MHRNQWSACAGIGGRHEPESVVGMHRNRWSAWPGLRIRRHAHVQDVLHIGKEANEIDKVQAGLIDSEEDVLLTYERDIWELIQPILAELPVAQVIERTGYSRSMGYRLRRGEKRPSGDRLQILVVLVAEYARERLVELGYQDVPLDDRMAVVMYERFLQREVKD